MISDIELGWLAGIIDGEGCITARLRQAYRPTGGTVILCVAIQSVSLGMILKAYDLGTRLSASPGLERDRWMQKSTRPAHKVSFHTKSGIYRLLTTVGPHLVVKQQEARLVLDFLKASTPGKCVHVPRGIKEAFVAALSAAKRSA